MSKIHEALSKAAREAKGQGYSGLVSDFVDIATEVHRSPALQEQFATAGASQKLENPAMRLAEIEKRCVRTNWKLNARMNVFLPGSDQKVAAERFRTLRSRLCQIAQTRKLQVVLVTSALPSEGKSFVAANLAHALVHQQGRKVLLIDADLRKPTQHELFGAPMTPGLTNYLQKEVDEYRIIQKGTDSDVFLIPAGNEVQNPSEFLLGDLIKTLLKSAAEVFDWIIIDSPPALAVHDASVVADLCDGVLFVVRAASTDFEHAARGCAEFRKDNLLGVVFNGAEASESNYGHSY